MRIGVIFLRSPLFLPLPSGVACLVHRWVTVGVARQPMRPYRKDRYVSDQLLDIEPADKARKLLRVGGSAPHINNMGL